VTQRQEYVTALLGGVGHAVRFPVQLICGVRTVNTTVSVKMVSVTGNYDLLLVLPKVCIFKIFFYCCGVILLLNTKSFF